jgi:hypothetical protein
MDSERLRVVHKSGLPISIFIGVLAIILYFLQSDPVRPPWYAGLAFVCALLAFQLLNAVRSSTFFTFERLMGAYLVIGIVLGIITPIYFDFPPYWTAAMWFYGALIAVGALSLLVYHYGTGDWFANLGPTVGGALMALITDTLRRSDPDITDWLVLKILFLVFLTISLIFLVYLIFRFRTRQSGTPGG